MILSGVLDEELPTVVAKLEAAGLTISRQLDEEEWSALECVRRSGLTSPIPSTGH